ncbi:DinB family protein [Mongoliibacter ruber]|uniref:Putative damage-inducible protein DinB n=1 Tax=Mongoliibacter ruber TaxID=1750599 RepID=A0A2T0WEH9_9BACT|nr:DinB family protein [Mongoliibacter ruber]PRY85123.1 putative damage-inducible protein DinB [Mongoliibacter ruber]
MKTQETMLTPISKDQFLNHWQGHRLLTRKVIETFPEKELFDFSIGGMRTFAQMVAELLAIAAPGVKGLATDLWEELDENDRSGNSKEKLLELWDKSTEEINHYWPQISDERFQEELLAFGQYKDKGYCTLLYFIDNEIHHRGQGYVYLRALGIEPPAFWERQF